MLLDTNYPSLEFVRKWAYDENLDLMEQDEEDLLWGVRSIFRSWLN